MTAEAFSVWATARLLRPAPAFSGGVLDSWPAWAVDAIIVADSEFAAIESYLLSRAQRKESGDG